MNYLTAGIVIGLAFCAGYTVGWLRGNKIGFRLGRDVEHNEIWCNQQAERARVEKARRHRDGKFCGKAEVGT